MGSVYPRKDSPYFWISYYSGGRNKCESSKSTLKTDAKNLLKLREGEVVKGHPLLNYSHILFKDITEPLIASYKMNGRKSIAKVRRNVRVLEAYFGEIKASQIDEDMIAQFIVKRQNDGLSNGSVNRELSSLKTILRMAYPKKIPAIPKIKMLKESAPRQGFIERETFWMLYKSLPEYLQTPVLFAYEFGWRREEIFGLKWDRINMTEGSVRIERFETKGGEAREAYFSNILKQKINELWLMRKLYRSNYVFLREGDRIQDFRWQWDKAIKAIGKPNLLFHDLRRTAVRNMIRAGIPERVAMMISGHRTSSIFARYDITSGRDLKEAAQKISNYNYDPSTIEGFIRYKKEGTND